MTFLVLFLSSTGLAKPALMEAAEAELSRTMSSLRLPEQPAPYFVGIEVLDGNVNTAWADFGSERGFDELRYRNLRVDVRVGDYELDSSNFFRCLRSAVGHPVAGASH